MASSSSHSTAGRPASWCPTSISGSRRNGSEGSASWRATTQGSGKPPATTATGTRGRNSGTTVISAPKPTGWQQAAVVSIHPETPRAKTIRFTVAEWPGHLPGQHVDVRLTADDGYRAERSYSIASPPGVAALEITV